MAKEVISTRIEPDLKREIFEEAEKDERKPAWLLEKIIRKGWEIYKSELAA